MSLNLDPALFHWAVYLQMPFWFFFYGRLGKRWEKIHLPFLIGWMGLMGILLFLKINGVDHLGTGKGRYPISLISFYALELIGCYILLSLRGWSFPKRISLSFLLTFFSSFFWEFPLHILDLLENGLTDRFLIQAIHLLPLIFFWMIYELKDHKSLVNWILLAHMITLGIVSLEMAGYLDSNWTFLIRGLDFIILNKIFFDGQILKLRSLSKFLNTS